MSYVISHYSLWIICGAFAPGILVGLLTWARKARGSWLSGWLSWAAVLFIIGFFAALFRLIEGRGGLWLETALAMFVAYIVGCVCGSWLRGLFAAPEPVLTPAAAGAADGGAATARADTFAGAEKSTPAPERARPASPSAAPAGADPATVATLAGATPFSVGSASIEAAPAAFNPRAAHPGHRPRAARDGERDDLRRIRGLSPANVAHLNRIGIYRFDQIARWTESEAAWVDSYLGAPGRLARERWIEQAGFWTRAQRLAASQSSSTPVAAVTTPATGAARAAEASVTAAPAPGDLEAPHPGVRPAGLSQPRDGVADDLKWIKGVGPKNEKALHALGVFHFAQIADWSPDNAQWAGSFMAFPGRIEREDWIGQCKLLASGQMTEHARRVVAGEADPALEENDAEHPGERPAALAGPRGGGADDLKRISGIGPQNERKLNGLGIYHFAQIAAWTAENAKWAGSFMAFPGRIERENWIGQAKVLAAGQETEFSRRVAAGSVPTSSARKE